jgi:hypothetical protein
MSALAHTRGQCDWCRWPLSDVAEEWAGGIGHPECVAGVERAVFPDAPGPYVHRRRFHRADPLHTFLERLGRAAVKHRVDARRLNRAIEEALHG